MKTKNFIQVESFEEIPIGYIKVNNNSSYFYISILDNNFIAIEKLNLATIINYNGIDRILCEKYYYDVINGNIILKVNSIYSLDDGKQIFSDKEENVNIIPLSKILNLSENTSSYLFLDDVKAIVDFKVEKPKIHRKTYF